MKYFVANHRSNVIRLGCGALLLIAIAILSITVVPHFAPSNFHNVIPIMIFGWMSLYFSTFIAVINHESKLSRFGGLAAGVLIALVVGGVVGSDVMDVAYGWFLAITCGSLAMLGACIGLLFVPRSDVLEDMWNDWSVAMHRY